MFDLCKMQNSRLFPIRAAAIYFLDKYSEQSSFASQTLQMVIAGLALSKFKGVFWKWNKSISHLSSTDFFNPVLMCVRLYGMKCLGVFQDNRTIKYL